MRMRVFRYPATPMLLIIIVYAFMRIPADERVRMVALLSMTAIGATELVLAAIVMIKDRSVRNAAFASHFFLAVGASTIGFALLEPTRTGLLALGSLLLASGLLVHQVTSPTRRSLDG